MTWENTLQKEIVQPGSGPVLGLSVFSRVCEIQENMKDSSVSIQVSVHLLQYQINHSSWGHDLVKDEILEDVLYLHFKIKY